MKIRDEMPHTITSIVPAGPAARSGIKIGNRVLAIDGLSVSDMKDVAEIRSRIAGPENSKVRLTLGGNSSGTEESFDVELARYGMRQFCWMRLECHVLNLGHVQCESVF